MASGIAIYHGIDITIDNNSVEQACTGTVTTQENISLCDVNSFTITNNHVFNCTNGISGAGGEGIDVKDGCSNGVISNNIVHDLAKIGIYIDAYSHHEYNIEVYENTVYNCPQGIVVATEKSGFLEDVDIHNNLVYNITNWGLAIGGWMSGYTHQMEDITFRNNTVYNAGDSCMRLNNSEAENVTIINNIFYTGGTYWDSPIYCDGGNLNETFIDHNFLDKITSGRPTGTNYIVGDPLFVDPSTFDFHLQSGSSAINAGLNLDGSVCNMGAF